MATATVYSATTDGQISSSDDEAGNYSIARNGTGVLTPNTLSATINPGQRLVGGAEYQVIEGFLSFDVSALAGATVTEATLSLWLVTDSSTTDFTIEARTHDWGATLTTADYVAGGNLAGKTLLASLTTVGIGTGAYVTLTNESTNLVDAITAALAGAGVVYVVLCSSRTTGNNAPTGNEFVTMSAADEAGTTQDPKLDITYTEAAGGSNHKNMTLLGVG